MALAKAGGGISANPRAPQLNGGFDTLINTLGSVGDSVEKRQNAGLEANLGIIDSQNKRNVLQDTQRSNEFDTDVSNQYTKLTDQLNQDQADIESEFNKSTNGISQYRRNPDGSWGVNPEFQAKDDVKTDMLEDLQGRQTDLDTEYGSRLDVLNKNTVNAFEGGAFNEVTDAKAFSNRIYENAIAQGVSIEDAEKMRKTEFERTKRPDLTDVQKERIDILKSNKKDKDKQIELMKIDEARSIGNTGVAGKASGTAKQRIKALSKTTQNLTPTEKIGQLDDLNKSIENTDLNPLWGNDVTRNNVRDLNSAYNKDPAYTPAMLNIALRAATENEGALISDRNIPGANLQKIKDNVARQIAEKKSQQKELISLQSSGSTGGRKDILQTTQVKNAKQLATLFGNNASATNDAINDILNEGKGSTSAGLLKKYFGDTSAEQTSMIKKVVKAENRKQDFGEAPSTTGSTKKDSPVNKEDLSGKKETDYVNSLSREQLNDPKFVDKNNQKVKDRLSILNNEPNSNSPIKDPKDEKVIDKSIDGLDLDNGQSNEIKTGLQKAKDDGYFNSKSEDYNKLSPEAKKIVDSENQSGDNFKNVKKELNLIETMMSKDASKLEELESNYNPKRATVKEAKELKALRNKISRDKYSHGFIKALGAFTVGGNALIDAGRNVLDSFSNDEEVIAARNEASLFRRPNQGPKQVTKDERDAADLDRRFEEAKKKNTKLNKSKRPSSQKKSDRSLLDKNRRRQTSFVQR